MNQKLYDCYVSILKRELVPAMGCTEPIAIAYAGALARQTLGKMPEHVELIVSGNIIKNVKSVIVPHTGGRKGLRTAVCAGIAVGNADQKLEVLSAVGEEELLTLSRYLETADVKVGKSDAQSPFDLQVTLTAGEESACVRIIGSHTNVVLIRKNGETLFSKPGPPIQSK